MQGGKFLENVKCKGWNTRAGGKSSGKSINVQGGNFLENRQLCRLQTVKVIVKFILTCLLCYLSQRGTGFSDMDAGM